VPPGVGDDRDAGEEACEVGPALDDERVLDAGQRLELLDVRARDLRPEHRRLLVDRVQHPRQLHVDAEQRLAGDDLPVVDPARELADDLVVLRVLERHARGRGHGQVAAFSASDA
jgi:hypothetical protein